jgi:hypothetical protein
MGSRVGAAGHLHFLGHVGHTDPMGSAIGRKQWR